MSSSTVLANALSYYSLVAKSTMRRWVYCMAAIHPSSLGFLIKKIQTSTIKRSRQPRGRPASNLISFCCHKCRSRLTLSVLIHVTSTCNMSRSISYRCSRSFGPTPTPSVRSPLCTREDFSIVPYILRNAMSTTAGGFPPIP